MRIFSESFFGEFFRKCHRYVLWNSLFSIYYKQLEAKICVFSKTLQFAWADLFHFKIYHLKIIVS